MTSKSNQSTTTNPKTINTKILNNDSTDLPPDSIMSSFKNHQQQHPTTPFYISKFEKYLASLPNPLKDNVHCFSVRRAPFILHPPANRHERTKTNTGTWRHTTLRHYGITELSFCFLVIPYKPPPINTINRCPFYSVLASLTDISFLLV